MAISAPTSMGTSFATASGDTIGILDPTAAVTAGAVVVVDAALYLNGATSAGVTIANIGTALTWTKVAETHGVGDANRSTYKFIAQAPTGLGTGSGNRISVTNSNGGTPVAGNNWHVTAAYITGQDTTTALDAAGSPGTQGTGSTWSTPNVTTTQANTILMAAAHRDGLSTSAADGAGGWTELVDFQNSSDSTTLTVVYKIVSGVTTYSTTGTWTGGAGEWVATIIAIKEAGGVSAASLLVPPFRFTSSLYSR